MKYDTIYYWVGGREAGEWIAVSTRVMEAADVQGSDVVVERMNRAGYVTKRGAKNVGPPEGPPADADFKAIGM